jgi:tRNA-binding protein
MATFSNFEELDIRAGTITDVQDFPEARKPAFKLWIDFGEFGIKKSSAQITKLYAKEELLGKQIIAVINFPPRQIGTFISEVLVLGIYGNEGEVILLQPERKVGNGLKIG